MDAEPSKNKKQRSGNPAHEHPNYSFNDHMSYAREKIKSVESFSEDQARRFKDGATKIISEIYENHTGLVCDMSQPPPIALDLSRKNATGSEWRPSTQRTDSSSMLQKSLRAHSDQNLMRSSSEDVMMAKKSYVSHTRPGKQLSRKRSRMSHPLPSTSSSQTCKSSVPAEVPKYKFPTVLEYLQQNPQWHQFQPPPTRAPRIIDTIDLVSDEE